MKNTAGLSLNEKFKNSLEDKTWGASVRFLDTLNSIAELDEIKDALLASEDAELEPFYRKNLTKWPNPEWSENFRERFPLLTGILDTPQKIRIFMRGAEFRNQSVSFMAEVFEEVVRKRQVENLKKITYSYHISRETSKGTALRIVYHTQVQAWTFTKLVLPDHASCGISSETGLWIDFRSKEEIEHDEKTG